MRVIAVGDTHGRESHCLPEELLSEVQTADVVIHTGDFITKSVFETIQTLSDSLVAVWGNNDSPEVQGLIPEQDRVSINGFRIVVVHGHNHSHTTLGYLGQEEQADIVIFGHSHSPQVVETDGVTLLNPGSYSTPRQFTPAYAVLRVNDGELFGELRDIAGGELDSFRILDC